MIVSAQLELLGTGSLFGTKSSRLIALQIMSVSLHSLLHSSFLVWRVAWRGSLRSTLHRTYDFLPGDVRGVQRDRHAADEGSGNVHRS